MNNLMLEEDALLMDWTVLPAGIIARAWKDDMFKEEFLKYPTATLQQLVPSCPKSCNFCVIENTEDTNYLVLPYRRVDTYGWGETKLKFVLHQETGGDNSLDFFLPVDVMVKAMCDFGFKQALLKNTNKVLRDMGYDIGNKNYVVLENTEMTHHLVLPQNKYGEEDLSVDELEELIIEDFLEEPTVH